MTTPLELSALRYLEAHARTCCGGLGDRALLLAAHSAEAGDVAGMQHCIDTLEMMTLTGEHLKTGMVMTRHGTDIMIVEVNRERNAHQVTANHLKHALQRLEETQAAMFRRAARAIIGRSYDEVLAELDAEMARHPDQRADLADRPDVDVVDEFDLRHDSTPHEIPSTMEDTIRMRRA